MFSLFSLVIGTRVHRIQDFLLSQFFSTYSFYTFSHVDDLFLFSFVLSYYPLPSRPTRSINHRSFPELLHRGLTLILYFLHSLIWYLLWTPSRKVHLPCCPCFRDSTLIWTVQTSYRPSTILTPLYSFFSSSLTPVFPLHCDQYTEDPVGLPNRK